LKIKSKKLTGFETKLGRRKQQKADVNKIIEALKGLITKECKIN